MRQKGSVVSKRNRFYAVFREPLSRRQVWRGGFDDAEACREFLNRELATMESMWQLDTDWRESLGVKIREKIPGSGLWWVFVSHRSIRVSKAVGTKDQAEKVQAELQEKLAVLDLERKIGLLLGASQELKERVGKKSHGPMTQKLLNDLGI
jgi:hypothetical protein